MLPIIVQHVMHGAPNLAGRAKDVRVVTVCEHPASTVHQLVQALGQADAEALHALPEGRLVGGLDDEVDVIALHGELTNAHGEPVRSREDGLAEYGEAAPRAEVPDVREHPQGDLHGEGCAQDGTPSVGDPRLGPLGLATGTLAGTAPGTEDEAALGVSLGRPTRRPLLGLLHLKERTSWMLQCRGQSTSLNKKGVRLAR